MMGIKLTMTEILVAESEAISDFPVTDECTNA